MTDKQFLLSLFCGPLIWLIFYFTTPMEPINPISARVLFFLFLNYICLLSGYFLCKKIPEKSIRKLKIKNQFIFNVVVILITIGFICRYVDLFYFRGLSFNNTFYLNKGLSSSSSKFTPIVLSILSTFKGLYFMPLIMNVVSNSRNKYYWIISIFLVSLIVPESILFGTRKLFFILFLLIVISILISKNRIILTKKIFLIKVFFGFIALMIISFQVIDKRMTESTSKKYWAEDLAKSRYNDFVPIKKEVREKMFINQNNTLLNNGIILFTHTGQYVTHGLYELDYVMNLKERELGYGVYTFFPIVKLTNKLNLSQIDIFNFSKYHPRGHVYLTFFGTLFVDFGWFTLLFSFFFGFVQFIIAVLGLRSNFFKTIWVYFLVINVSLPILSLIRGGGLYPIFSIFLITIFAYFFNIKTENEESPNS